MDVPANRITIAPAPDGSPFPILAGEGPLPVTLSISHRQGSALVALCSGRQALLGADLEVVEPKIPAFVDDFFTRSEIAALRELPREEVPRGIAEVWSLKEAALKAIRRGLTESTHAVEGLPRSSPGASWTSRDLSLSLKDAPSDGVGFVRSEGRLVLSVAWLGSEPLGAPDAALRGFPVLDDCQRAVA